MIIYPAIDIMSGKAVRLKQGRATEATIYGDPVDMAIRWRDGGAEWLHVVDLDGAFAGEPTNTSVLERIARALPSVKIQSGGGIRNMASLERLLETGVHRVVLGTAAVQDADFVRHALSKYARNVAVGIDARDGNVRVAGWTRDSNIGAIELAQKLEKIGAQTVIYTDISRDGVLEGSNIEATMEMMRSIRLHVIASGGVSSIADIERLASLNEPRLDGVIIGTALYEGRIRIEEAMVYAR